MQVISKNFQKLRRNFILLYNSIHINNKWKDGGAVLESEILVGNGTLKLSSGKLARFADGSSVAQLGDTTVLVTVVSKAHGSSNSSFTPLTVDYRQKSAAAGRIPTNYLRRELGASDREILIARMIDRSLRPLFPTGYSNETQVICNLLAVDGLNDPIIASINAASFALSLSNIPWNGPIGAVQVGHIDGEAVVNPTRLEMKDSKLNMIIAASDKNRVVMVDSSSDNITHAEFQKCLKEGVKKAQAIILGIQKITSTIQIHKRDVPTQATLPEHVKELMFSMSEPLIKNILTDFSHHKISRDECLAEVKDQVLKTIYEKHPDLDVSLVNAEYQLLVKTIFRDLIMDSNIRCDGRNLTDIRPLSCEIGLYAPLHGSALFQRGQTQVICTATFDSPESAAKVDTISSLLSGIKEKNFFLHYEFPPYATNEVGRMGMAGRRELGHGALAEKALRPVIPPDYPFTIRLTAEVLESNGSSSMASVCAGSLTLLDAGVNIGEPLSGVAMGLVSKLDEYKQIVDYRLLTDQLGIEDYMGDMDFKMAGSKTGVTALQMDTKLPGLPLKVVMDSIQAAGDANRRLIDFMNKTISRPREIIKSNLPVIENIEVPITKRSKFLGIGGINLKKILSETGVTVTAVDETNYQLFAPNKEAMAEGKEKIENILSEEKEVEFEFGAIYRAKIVELKDYGLLVQLHPTMSPTLIHNSQLDVKKIEHPSILGFQVGQEISVKYFGRDPANGRIRLSRKVLLMPSSAAPVKNLNS